MGQTIFVIAEHKDGVLRQVSLEALQLALTLAGSDDRVVSGLLGQDVSAAANALAAYPHAEVLVMEHPQLAVYNPETYFPAAHQLLNHVQPTTVILGHTALGRDLAPQLAAHLGAGQLSDVVAVDSSVSGDAPRFTRPIYAGKAFETKRFTTEARVITVRPNNLPTPAVAGAAAGAGTPTVVQRIEYTAPNLLRAIIRDVVKKVSSKVDLTEARIVVSGGRGVKSADGFQPLQALADLLGAAVGASRGACDAGYCDYSLQIGQTGKVVTPEVYIACGISGAIQHLAGMSQSRMIVAINKDPEAPIFQVADYGIVGDLFEVVPLLTEELERALQEEA